MNSAQLIFIRTKVGKLSEQDEQCLADLYQNKGESQQRKKEYCIPDLEQNKAMSYQIKINNATLIFIRTKEGKLSNKDEQCLADLYQKKVGKVIK